MTHTGPWQLSGQAADFVEWQCAVCANKIRYVTEGNGSPFSGTVSPPETIDVDINSDCVEAVAPPVREPISKLAFLERLTAEETSNILSSQDTNVRVFMYRFEQAQDIILDSPELLGGLQYLAFRNLIAAERITEILS